MITYTCHFIAPFLNYSGIVHLIRQDFEIQMIMDPQFITIACILLLLSLSSPSIRATSDQYIGLSALYISAGGSSWSNKSGWLVDDDPCTGWNGVTCSNSVVTQLQLENNNLVGSLPSQFVSIDHRK